MVIFDEYCAKIKHIVPDGRTDGTSITIIVKTKADTTRASGLGLTVGRSKAHRVHHMCVCTSNKYVDPLLQRANIIMERQQVDQCPMELNAESHYNK